MGVACVATGRRYPSTGQLWGRAKPDYRATTTRWIRWLDGSELSVRWEMTVAKHLMIPNVSSERPPSVSATTWTNSTRRHGMGRGVGSRMRNYFRKLFNFNLQCACCLFLCLKLSINLPFTVQENVSFYYSSLRSELNCCVNCPKLSR